MEKILEMIDRVSAEDIHDVLHAVKRRFERLFPGYEAEIFTIEKKGGRTERIDAMIRLLEAAKKDV